MEVALLENQHQGQPVSSQRVVDTCRLPWHFKVGKTKGGQAAPAAFTNGAAPSQNDPGSPSGQRPMDVDTPTPRPCSGNGLGVPTLEPLILSSPRPLSHSDGKHQGAPCVPTSNTQALVARGPGANWVAEPTQGKKRGRVEADLDNEVSQNTNGKRPRLGQLVNAPAGIAGPSAPSANHSPSRLLTTPAGTIPHGVSSSNGSSNSPAASATPSAPQPDPSLRPVQRHRSPAQPVEPTTTVLRDANPRCGPVSGGLEIWLEMDDLPTTFTLYAKFGDRVAATVSSTSHPFSQSSSNLHISRFGISVR